MAEVLWRLDGEAVSTAPGDQFAPTVALDGSGGMVVGWRDKRDGVVDAYEQSGQVFRTDRDGAVFLSFDGTKTEIRTWSDRAGGRTWRERIRWLFEGV